MRGGGGTEADAFQEGLDVRRDGGGAIGGGEESGQGDTDLDGGQEPVGVARQCGDPGPALPALKPVVDNCYVLSFEYLLTQNFSTSMWSRLPLMRAISSPTSWLDGQTSRR